MWIPSFPFPPPLNFAPMVVVLKFAYFADERFLRLCSELLGAGRGIKDTRGAKLKYRQWSWLMRFIVNYCLACSPESFGEFLCEFAHRDLTLKNAGDLFLKPRRTKHKESSRYSGKFWSKFVVEVRPPPPKKHPTDFCSATCLSEPILSSVDGFSNGVFDIYPPQTLPKPNPSPTPAQPTLSNLPPKTKLRNTAWKTHQRTMVNKIHTNTMRTGIVTFLIPKELGRHQASRINS